MTVPSAGPVKISQADLDHNGLADDIYTRVENGTLTISVVMNPQPTEAHAPIDLYLEKNAGSVDIARHPWKLQSCTQFSMPDCMKLNLPSDTPLDLESLYNERIALTSHFDKEIAALTALIDYVARLSAKAPSELSAREAAEAIKNLEDKIDEIESAARWHRESNDSDVLRALAKEYEKRIKTIRVDATLLNDDYRAVVNSLVVHRDFPGLDDAQRRWFIDNIQSSLPKRAVSSAEKEEYRKLVARDVEIRGDLIVKIGAVKKEKSYPVSLTKFRVVIANTGFLQKAEKYKREGGDIFIPASDVDAFTQLCASKDRALALSVWNAYQNDLAEAVDTPEQSLALEIVANYGRRAEILGWKSWAEYELRSSVAGGNEGAKGTRKALEELHTLYRPRAKEQIAEIEAQARRDGVSPNIVDFNRLFAQQTQFDEKKIPEEQRPTLGRAIEAADRQVKEDLGMKYDPVAYAEFRKDWPTYPLPVAQKSLRFYRAFDASGKYIGYRMVRPLKGKHGAGQPLSRLLVQGGPSQPFLFAMELNISPPAQGKPEDVRLDFTTLKEVVHENIGHGTYYALRNRFDFLGSDGSEIPSLSVETRFFAADDFLRRLYRARDAALVRNAYIASIDNPLSSNEMAELAMRNINDFSVPMEELQRAKNMRDIEAKHAHKDRARLSLFSPKGPDADSFILADFMFYFSHGNLDRYVISNRHQMRLASIEQKVGSSTPGYRRLYFDSFVTPSARSAAMPLSARLGAFEREALALQRGTKR